MTREEQEVNARISETIEQLMKRTDTYATLAGVTGQTAQTIGRKMRNEREWTATEVYLLARHFDVAESTLFAGSDALFVGIQRPAAKYPAPTDRLFAGSADFAVAA